MVKRVSHGTAACPVARSLDAVGDWWALLIIRDALRGRKRFSEFQKSTGAAKNILAARLRGLVAFGILQSIPASDGSAYHEYVLTRKGLDLFPVVATLWQWGEKHFFTTDEPAPVMRERGSNKPVPRLEVRAADGRRLRHTDTNMMPRDAG